MICVNIESNQKIIFCAATQHLLAQSSCIAYVGHMLNIISILIGLIALILAIPAFIPLLGAINWVIVPIALFGVLIGALSRSNTGRNLCLIVTAICVIRLWLGGGLF